MPMHAGSDPEVYVQDLRPTSGQDRYPHGSPDVDVGHYELELETIPVIEFRIEEPETFGEYIKKLRILKGWSQKELANRIGAYPTTIIDWEKDRCMPARKWRVKLIKALGADVWQAIQFDGVLTKRQREMIRAFSSKAFTHRDCIELLGLRYLHEDLRYLVALGILGGYRLHEWYHVLGRFYTGVRFKDPWKGIEIVGSMVLVYIDGRHMASALSLEEETHADTQSSFYVGGVRNRKGSYFSGCIDKLRVSNVAAPKVVNAFELSRTSCLSGSGMSKIERRLACGTSMNLRAQFGLRMSLVKVTLSSLGFLDLP